MKHRDRRTGRIGRHRYAELVQLILSGLTAPQIADRFQVNAETIRKFARNRGLTITRQDENPERHPSWKGGTTIDKQGYVMQRVDYDGPYGYLIRRSRPNDPRGYAPQHRIAMHNTLGRRLDPREVVHHIDGNVANNNPSNLMLFPTNADHLRATITGQVPNWTEDGKRRIREGLQRAFYRRRMMKQAATARHPKTDDRPSP